MGFEKIEPHKGTAKEPVGKPLTEYESEVLTSQHTHRKAPIGSIVVPFGDCLMGFEKNEAIQP